VEPAEGVSVVHTQQLLTKMFLEQNISFVKVSKNNSSIVFIVLYATNKCIFHLVSIKVTATNASIWQEVQIISMYHSFIRVGY